MRRIRWVALAGAIALMTSAIAAGAGAATGEALKASDVGVSATEIRIAIVADVDNAIRPGLFQSSVDAVNGFAKFINSKDGGGGLAGRKVVVDFIDSKLNPNETRNAVIKACQQDFAMVGTGAIFLNNVDDMVNCKDINGAATGIPDLPFTATDLHQACSPKTFPLNPPAVDCSTKDAHPQTYHAAIGRTFFYKTKVKEPLHGVFVYSGQSQTAYNAQLTSAQGAVIQAGVKADVPPFKLGGSPQQSEFTPIVQTMRSNNSNFAQVGNPYDQTVLLRKEAKLQGVDAKIWDCSSPCYDTKFLSQGGADVEGEYVSLANLPFIDAPAELKANKMTGYFLKYVGKDKATGFGISSFSAGVLLRDAINDAVKTGGNNNVTRKAVFDYLNTKATAFSADGMIGTTNISKRQVSPCYLLLQVKGGKYVRVHPTKPGTMDCAKKNVITYQADVQ